MVYNYEHVYNNDIEEQPVHRKIKLYNNIQIAICICLMLISGIGIIALSWNYNKGDIVPTTIPNNSSLDDSSNL
jgi:hypothetical protein